MKKGYSSVEILLQICLFFTGKLKKRKECPCYTMYFSPLTVLVAVTDIKTDFFKGSPNVSCTFAQDIFKLSGFLRQTRPAISARDEK